MIQWPTLTEEQKDDYQRCVERILTDCNDLYSGDRLLVEMDLAALHSQCPLNFKGLAEFPEEDFLHDVLGFVNHIDRETGELCDGFVPRCRLS